MSTCEGINGGAVSKVDTERLLIGLFTSCTGLSNSLASFITNSFITDSVTSLTWAEVTIIDQFSIGSRTDHSESSFTFINSTLSKVPQTWACPFGSSVYIDVRRRGEWLASISQTTNQSRDQVVISVLQWLMSKCCPLSCGRSSSRKVCYCSHWLDAIQFKICSCCCLSSLH